MLISFAYFSHIYFFLVVVDFGGGGEGGGGAGNSTNDSEKDLTGTLFAVLSLSSSA